MDFGLSARNIGFRLVDRILKATLVDTEQWLALAHLLVVVNKNVADQSGNIGCYRNHVGAHTAVARPWFEHIITPELPADGNRHEQRNERDQHTTGRGEKVFHDSI